MKLSFALFALFALLASSMANAEEPAKEYEGASKEYENSPSAAPSGPDSSSDSPTASPSVDISTVAPSRKPTFAFTFGPTAVRVEPTSFPTSRPTYALGESGCKDIATTDECQARGLDCEWYVMNPCNYLVKPVTCAQFKYGCQERRSFCEFTKGTRLQKEMQCNFKNYPCKWKSGPAKCVYELSSSD